MLGTCSFGCKAGFSLCTFNPAAGKQQSLLVRWKQAGGSAASGIEEAQSEGARHLGRRSQAHDIMPPPYDWSGEQADDCNFKKRIVHFFPVCVLY